MTESVGQRVRAECTIIRKRASLLVASVTECGFVQSRAHAAWKELEAAVDALQDATVAAGVPDVRDERAGKRSYWQVKPWFLQRVAEIRRTFDEIRFYTAMDPTKPVLPPNCTNRPEEFIQERVVSQLTSLSIQAGTILSFSQHGRLKIRELVV